MSRRHKSADSSPFDTIRLEGSLFVPELLERAARGEASLQAATDYAIPKGLKLHDEYGRAYRIATALWHELAAQIPRADLDPVAATRSFARDLLRQCLGFADLRTVNELPQIGDRAFPISAHALGQRVPVVIAPHTLALDEPDPQFALEGSGSRKKSAHQLVQEYLNADPQALWGIVTNGRTLRLVRDAETLTRPNFLEFDLETILREGEARYADFSAFWRILHASRAGSLEHPAAECVWEKWRTEGHAQGLRVRDGLRDGVTQAILILANGFLTHRENDALRQRLHDGSLTLDAYFQQFFRLIYRCLFLFCTEERDLLHSPDAPITARQAYATGYGLRRLRSRCLRQVAHDPHGDLWVSLKIVFKSLANGQPLLALPALGGLFAETQCPDLDTAALSNRDLLSAMRELRWFFDKKTGKRSAIDYRNMGTEELGSVYESLLELVPTLNLPARTFGFAGITDAGSTSGNARKTTGSFYTPDSLVMELINSALEPVIRQRLAEARELATLPWADVAKRIQADPIQRDYVLAYLGKHAAVPADARPEALGRAWDAIPAVTRANPLCAEALLSLTVCDPSCGSGHFLLAAARRLAERLAELRAPDGAVRPDDYRHALREVASRCLYGVDINPMAVELCRVALWLETVDPGKPLGFLDHHIRCGNSLIGATPELIAAGLPDEAFKPIEGDDKAACAELKKLNKKEREGFGPLFETEEQFIRDQLRMAAARIDGMDDTLPDALHRKEIAFETSERTPEYVRAKLLADLWSAAFVIKKTNRIGITTGTLRSFVQGGELAAGLKYQVDILARQYRFFHWHLAYPQVFARGGFGCILGNPPWERPKPEPSKYFATSRPDIADAQTSALRDRMLEKLKSDDPQRFADWSAYERSVLAAVSFQTASGAFPLSSLGKFNLGNTFVEQARNLLLDRGRAGLLNVSGLATDDSGKSLISDLMTSRTLVSFFDFENRDGLFPAIHRSYRFSAITIAGSATNGCPIADFVFSARSVEELRLSERHIVFSAEDIHLLNPISGNCPIFTDRSQAELVKAIYRIARLRQPPSQVLWDWDAEPTFLFVMSDHSGLFETRETIAIGDFGKSPSRPKVKTDQLLPLYESKMFHQYEHRWASLNTAGIQEDFTPSQRQDPTHVAVPRYWMRAPQAAEKLNALPNNWLPAVREVTRCNDERTVIATILPKYPVGHNAQVIRFHAGAPAAASFLANLNAFALDFAARTKVGGAHLSSFILRQLPILGAPRFEELCDWSTTQRSIGAWILPRVLELTYTAWDLEPFALDCGWNGPPLRWDEERRFLLRCELDAAFFHLYLGSEAEWQEQPEALTRAFPTPRHSVSYIMDTFPIVKRKDEAKHGHYRTKDTILQIYDALTQAITTGRPYQTLLSPPPADPACCHPPRRSN